MYSTLLDIDRFVSINELKEITDGNYLQFGRPTPNGLFSYEIFGVSQQDRSSIWAYIDLGARFLHPLAAINFRRYGRQFDHIIHGTKNYVFKNGEFVEDEANGETGLDFLYRCYDDIKWKDTDSETSAQRIEFLKQGKNKLFITKWPVSPPFYRDINDNDAVGIPVVNELYKKLVTMCTSLKKKGSFLFFGTLTQAKIQDTLIELYDHYIGMLKGKFGLLRRDLMSRNTDYGVWNVLSSPVIKCNRYEEMPVTFERMGYPMASLISAFKPFVIQNLKERFSNIFERSGKFTVVNTNGDVETVDLIDPMTEYSSSFLDKKLTEFIKGYSTRFAPIAVPKNTQNKTGYLQIELRDAKTGNITKRLMTWTDLLYMTLVDVTANKNMVFSRYPIEHYLSIEYLKIHVLSTTQTQHVFVNSHEYPYYPVVKPNMDSDAVFIETVTPFNGNIATLGADFDGDSCPSRSIMSQEANAEADAWQHSKQAMLNACGINIRTTEKDMIQSLYSLTKPPAYVEIKDPN